MEKNQFEDQSSCSKRLLKKDTTTFRNYIENTTTHGVVRIFSSRSIIRRLFWLFIVVGATIGCLYNCIDRIRFLARDPISTAISIRRVRPVDFPAVTINFVTRDGVDQAGILDLAAEVLNLLPEFLVNGSNCSQGVASAPNASILILNVQQDQYIQYIATPSLDAGVRIISI